MSREPAAAADRLRRYNSLEIASEQATCFPDLFIAQHFKDERGDPDPVLTTETLLLSGLSAEAQAALANEAAAVPGLETAFFPGCDRFAIGWGKGEIWTPRRGRGRPPGKKGASNEVPKQERSPGPAVAVDAESNTRRVRLRAPQKVPKPLILKQSGSATSEEVESASDEDDDDICTSSVFATTKEQATQSVQKLPGSVDKARNPASLSNSLCSPDKKHSLSSGDDPANGNRKTQPSSQTVRRVRFLLPAEDEMLHPAHPGKEEVHTPQSVNEAADKVGAKPRTTPDLPSSPKILPTARPIPTKTCGMKKPVPRPRRAPARQPADDSATSNAAAALSLADLSLDNDNRAATREPSPPYRREEQPSCDNQDEISPYSRRAAMGPPPVIPPSGDDPEELSPYSRRAAMGPPPAPPAQNPPKRKDKRKAGQTGRPAKRRKGLDYNPFFKFTGRDPVPFAGFGGGPGVSTAVGSYVVSVPAFDGHVPQREPMALAIAPIKGHGGRLFFGQLWLHHLMGSMVLSKDKTALLDFVERTKPDAADPSTAFAPRRCPMQPVPNFRGHPGNGGGGGDSESGSSSKPKFYLVAHCCPTDDFSVVYRNCAGEIEFRDESLLMMSGHVDLGLPWPLEFTGRKKAHAGPRIGDTWSEFWATRSVAVDAAS